MAFSQSFEFGNSTFDNLETEVKRAIVDHPSEENLNCLDVIHESPTGQEFSSKSLLSKAHSRMQQTKNGNTSSNSSLARRRFRRSKSDSTLQSKPVANNSKLAREIENYSELFRSEFSILSAEKETKTEKEIDEPMMRVSHLEAVLNESFNNSVQEAVSVFEAPICSEDVRDLLSTETDAEFGSLEISTTQNNAAEELPLLDTSCFVCPASDEKASQQLAKDLERSRCELAQAGHDSQLIKNHKNPMDVSLSGMSPEQLKWTQTAQSQLPKIPQAKMLNKDKKQIASTHAGIADKEALKQISAWNLPHSVLNEYAKKGVKQMFDWQVECLCNVKVLFEHCNLVYSAPTSAGKTLVSEILLLKSVLERGKKVLLILPFISVVREKMFYLQDLLTTAGYRVEGFFGGYTPPGGFESIHVAICTIEKANSIVNKLMEQGKLDAIGTVIVDEVHLISDPGRGYILELLLAKILYMSRKYSLQIQVITMSATLANVELLKRWLDAELFITDFRPVALQEMIKVGNKVYDNKLQILRDVMKPLPGQLHAFPALGNDSDHVAQLCIETLLEGCSVIVFCPSKDWCENLAVQLAGAIHTVGKSGDDWGRRLRAQLNREAINEVKKQLRDIPTGLDAVLEKTITFGCAFHHAGLTTEERDIVEASFKSCALKIIVATSTLSSGVNLPARRVLIRSPLFGGKQMSSLTYRQMIGRAGRMGKDTLGESILICTDSNARIGRQLIQADLNPISSCLEMDSSTHLKRALLEVISSGVAASKADIDSFVNCTLLSTQKKLQHQNRDINGEQDDEDSFVNDALDFLEEYEFVRLQQNEETAEDHYVATRLGLACLASSMPPTDGLILFAELQKSRRCFVLESELHAVYLVTPYSVCYQLQDLDWLLYLDMWEKLTPAMKKVGELVGVKEAFLVRAMRSLSKLDYKLMQIHKRFYTALALQELVNETPINVVAHKFKCTRGMLQSLQQMASTFAGIVTSFCTALQWSTLSLIVSEFKERLYFGIHRDLIDLMRLPNLTHKRARVLFDAGITSLVELAHANSFDVEKGLYNSLSFDLAKQHEHENSHEAAQRNTARNFFITGKAGLTVADAAKRLIHEARQFVQYELGVGNIKWTQESMGAEHNSTTTKVDEALHMSCEEEQTIEKTFKRKADEQQEAVRRTESPPKLPKIEKNSENTNTKQADNIAKQTVIPTIMADNKVENIANGNCNAVNRNKAMQQANKEVAKANELTIKRSVESLMEKTSRAAQPGSRQKSEDKTNTESVSMPKAVEEQPSTSLAVRKHLLQKQIEERRLEALKRIKKKRAEIDNGQSNTKENQQSPESAKYIRNNLIETANNKENIISNTPTHATQFKSPAEKQKRSTQRPSQVQRVQPEHITQTEKTNGKGGTTPKLNMPQVPRRSPRNHASTQGTANGDSKSNEVDLFMADESFMLNTGVTAALTIAEHTTNKCGATPDEETANDDEIPNSQQMYEQPVSQTSCAAQTPHGSRFLRSYQQQRTQRLASPRPKQENEKTTASNSPTKIPAASAAQSNGSIELSDMSMENSLMKNPIQLNSSHILSCSKVDTDASSFKSIEIIDMCGDAQVFKSAFKELLAAKRLGFSVGLQQLVGKRKPIIGANLLINQVANNEAQSSKSLLHHIDDANFVAGLAFSIEDNLVYYMNMQDDEEHGKACKHITAEIKRKYLRQLFATTDVSFLMHDAKEQLKVLQRAMPDLQQLQIKLEDPKVGNWLLQPDKMLTFHNMCQQFAPECIGLVELCGSARRCYTSCGLDSDSAILAKLRCAMEACVTVHILKGQIENLERIGTGQLHKFFIELEMPIQMSLCNMELYGFCVRENKLQKLFQLMVNTMKRLEHKIYEMHGTRFNLGSSAAVAKVVGLHRKTNGRVSTSRQILEKLDSPISQMIITYRKLSVILTNNVQPLLKCVQQNRIHGQSITYTPTGRISMVEPNLQNVAKDFTVEVGAELLTISCRSAFAPNDEKRCLISSDFCQLEMRILAHLSQDAALLEVMKSERDLFVAIAARWNKISEDAVSEQVRNGTKQICYAIVYGMGMRSLAEALKCTEQEANLVSQQFHAAYPGIRAYTEKVVKFARNNGYIETITGRRRYLDNINSDELQMKNHAERQAVNSTVQGSAADIAKSAILRMEKNIEKYRGKLGIDPEAVRLVLHLHDELFFEVPTDKAKKIAKVLRLTMENCVRLSVPLKVKLRSGRSWGELSDVNT